MIQIKNGRQNWRKAFKSLSKFEVADAEYLWKPYIPLNFVTLIEGDGGRGKSWFTIAIAAAVSRGFKLPGQRKTRKGKVLIMSAEDDPSIQLRPRLESCGGNTEVVFIDDNKFSFDDDGLWILRRNIQRYRPLLVIIDPIVAYMGEGKNMNSATDVRPMFTEFADMASEYNCAIVVVRHLRKSGSDNINHRGMGSVDMINAVRSGLLVDKEIDNPKTIRAIMHQKCNLTAPGKTLCFEIEKSNERPGARFVWKGTADYDADEYNKMQQKGPGASNEKRMNALALLQNLLASGPMQATEVEAIAEASGIKHRTLARAKEELGIVSKRKGKIWVWRLP